MSGRYFNGSLAKISSITELENSIQLLPSLLFTDKVFDYYELEQVNLSEDTVNKKVAAPSILDIAAAYSNSTKNRRL